MANCPMAKNPTHPGGLLEPIVGAGDAVSVRGEAQATLRFDGREWHGVALSGDV